MIRVLHTGGLGRMEGSKTEQDHEEIKKKDRKIQNDRMESHYKKTWNLNIKKRFSCQDWLK